MPKNRAPQPGTTEEDFRRRLARGMTDAMARLHRTAVDPSAKPADRLSATIALIERGYGKPRQVVKHSVQTGTQLLMDVVELADHFGGMDEFSDGRDDGTITDEDIQRVIAEKGLGRAR